MFKKTLLALSVAAMSTTAMAATITATDDVFSRQGIASETSVALNSTGDVSIALAAEYAVGDILTVTITGADVDADASTPVLTATMPDGNDTMTLGLLSVSGNVITFRVTELTYDGNLAETTIAADLVLTGVELDTDSVVAASTVSVSYAAKTSTDIPLDVNDTEEVATVVDQFTSSVTTALNGVVDVNNDRQQFTNVGPDNATTDTLTITPVDGAVLAALKADYTGATYTVKGDFSFLDTDGDGEVSGAELTAGVAVTTSGDDTSVETLNETMDELEVAVTAITNDTIETVDVVFTVAGLGDGNPVLDVQSFTVDTVVEYDDAQADAGTLATETDESAGSWTINGSQITFPYAPIGYSHIVTQFEIANSGTQNGVITLDAFDTAGNEYSAELSVLANAGKVTSLKADTLVEALGLAAGTKLSLTITISAPADDIKISGYSNLNNTGRMALLSDVYEGM